MNIYFSGIGGVGIGPLAEIAHDAGHTVQGSDMAESLVTRQLQKRGITVSYEQDGTFLQACHNNTPVDWFVYTSALPPDHSELILARQLGIKTAKRDELLAQIIAEKNLKLIAVAGTHGKTTTTGMLIWTMQRLGTAVSYSIGTTLSFGPSGKYDPASEYFIYECDEFDRNFLYFSPWASLITNIDYDHSDTYPNQDDYLQAFNIFIGQSGLCIMWNQDLENPSVIKGKKTLLHLIDRSSEAVSRRIDSSPLPGRHNRENAYLVSTLLEDHLGFDERTVQDALARFPGTDRRFERISSNLYTDYGHHPAEIAATLQLARELSDQVVLVYQPHQNIRQHEIRGQYTNCFELAAQIYWLPTYLSREDPNLPILTPDELTQNITNKDLVHIAQLDDELWDHIQKARDEGKLVLCMGAGTIDSWTRDQLAKLTIVNVLMINQDGSFVLQKRDNKPGISNPNMVTGFGGHVDPNDPTLRDAATRELREETNLSFTPQDLRYFKTYHKTVETHGEDSYVTFYTLSSQNTEELQVYEGQGFEIVSPNDKLDDILLSPLVRQVIRDYTG